MPETRNRDSGTRGDVRFRIALAVSELPPRGHGRSGRHPTRVRTLHRRLEALEVALGPAHHSIVDVSANRAVFELRGTDRLERLAEPMRKNPYGQYLLALAAGLAIGNFAKGFAAKLGEAARPEWYIKTAIVFLGVNLGAQTMKYQINYTPSGTDGGRKQPTASPSARQAAVGRRGSIARLARRLFPRCRLARFRSHEQTTRRCRAHRSRCDRPSCPGIAPTLDRRADGEAHGPPPAEGPPQRRGSLEPARGPSGGPVRRRRASAR